MLEVIQSKYNCKAVNAGVFEKVMIEGAKFRISAFDVRGVGRVATIDMKRLIGLWEMQSLIITPYEKDAPIYYYNRHREKGNYIYRVEMFDTQLDTIEVSEMINVEQKYKALPDEEQNERWYEEIKLYGAVKKVEKSKKEELSPLILEHFQAYMTMLENAPNCKSLQKKKRVTTFVKELCEKCGVAIIEIFLANYGPKVTEKLANEVLFGLK